MKQIMLVILAIVSMVLFCSISYAAPKKTKILQPKYSSEPIDLSASNLGANYLGHNIKSIYVFWDGMENSNKKDKFETTDQYEKRLLSARSKPIIGGINKDGLFAISIKPKFDYDADKSNISLKIETRTVQSRNYEEKFNNQVLAVKVLEKSDKPHESVGSNSFGASTIVTTQNTSYFNLAVLNPEVIGHVSKNSYYDGTVFTLSNISVELAKILDDKVDILLICKLSKPYISDGFSGSDPPTINNPTAYYNAYFNVYMTIKEAWIFNKKTGEILKKEIYKDNSALQVYKNPSPDSIMQPMHSLMKQRYLNIP